MVPNEATKVFYVCPWEKMMKRMFLVQVIVATMVMLFASATVQAQGLRDYVRNITKSVDADPKKEYVLTEMEGPYLIFAAGFSGPNAQQDARALVLEFRKTYKWNAYVYEKNFTFDLKKDFKEKVRNPNTGMKSAYKNSGSGEFAVVIGNFSSFDDKQLEKTLDEVRKCQPKSLQGKGSLTPCSMAFPSPNPMLPPENQRGTVDPFIESINKERPYSLLKNRRRYTVQIAVFTGQIIMQRGSSALEKLPFANPDNLTKLEKGEQAATALCKALREQGVEAYEFHDRYGSIVTVGGFDQHSRQLPNGAVELEPSVLQTIRQYQGKIINGIECDPQPRVIEVPRVSRTR